MANNIVLPPNERTAETKSERVDQSNKFVGPSLWKIEDKCGDPLQSCMPRPGTQRALRPVRVSRIVPCFIALATSETDDEYERMPPKFSSMRPGFFQGLFEEV